MVDWNVLLYDLLSRDEQRIDYVLANHADAGEVAGPWGVVAHERRRLLGCGRGASCGIIRLILSLIIDLLVMHQGRIIEDFGYGGSAWILLHLLLVFLSALHQGLAGTFLHDCLRFLLWELKSALRIVSFVGWRILRGDTPNDRHLIKLGIVCWRELEKSLLCEAALCRLLDLSELILRELSLLVEWIQYLSEELFLDHMTLSMLLKVSLGVSEEAIEFLLVRLDPRLLRLCASLPEVAQDVKVEQYCKKWWRGTLRFILWFYDTGIF